MTNKYIQISWTCESIEEARRISQYLVQAKKVACANIIPRIESIFLWNDKLDIIQETKVIFKTKEEYFEDVKKIILENCKYEVPEILKICIEGGNQAYLDWIDKMLAPPS